LHFDNPEKFLPDFDCQGFFVFLPLTFTTVFTGVNASKFHFHRSDRCHGQQENGLAEASSMD
jgi:hypothetical protein